jgi:hypothetical protein
MDGHLQNFDDPATNGTFTAPKPPLATLRAAIPKGKYGDRITTVRFVGF